MPFSLLIHTVRASLSLPNGKHHNCVSLSETCYADPIKSRVLPYPIGGHPPSLNALTREGCMQMCHDADFTLAGVENGKQCFCGNATSATAQKLPTGCQTPCGGDATENCGGHSEASVLRLHCGSGPPDPFPPTHPPTMPPPTPPPAPRPPFNPKNLNVLYIMSDDMRTELNTYGSTYMHTPNFDKFAASGTLFERGYIAVSVCMPSRTAGLTSRRPTRR
jgi:hypothetical protein